MSSEIRTCASCIHYRLRPQLQLFTGDDLQTAGVLKARTQWDAEQRQAAQAEQQRFLAKQPFDFEPQHYAWCDFHTRVALAERAASGDQEAFDELVRMRAAVVNPVSGAITPLYQLCAWMNPEGRCAHHESH